MAGRMEMVSPLRLLEVPTFCLLSEEEINLIGDLECRRYPAGAAVVDAGGDKAQVLVVLEGEVHVFRQGRRVGNIVAPYYFGEIVCVLGGAHTTDKVAGVEGCLIGIIERSVIVNLVTTNRFVAQSLGRKIHERSDLFEGFRNYCRALFDKNPTEEYLDLTALLHAYRQINCSIHGGVNEPWIDMGALRYAVTRLPHNITGNSVYMLTYSLPPFIAGQLRESLASSRSRESSLMHVIEPVSTDGRRRSAWSLGLGKTVVLLRDHYTDLLDFTSCCCAYIIEAMKIRRKLQRQISPPVLALLDPVWSSPDTEDEAVQRGVMSQITELTEDEKAALLRLWPKDCLLRLADIMTTREAFLLRVDRGEARLSECSAAHKWVMKIRCSVMKMLGHESVDHIPEDLQVHIISSNTHSIQNCLNPGIRLHADRIRRYGEEHHPDVMKEPWPHPDDLLYGLLPKYLKDNEQYAEDLSSSKEKHGIVEVRDTAATGLGVCLVNVCKLDFPNADGSLSGVNLDRSSKGPRFLVNIDYAFGAQADGILRALILLFGHRIRSINIMGKAGGLVGNRGDIQVPSAVVYSKSTHANDCLDEYRKCGNQGVSAVRLRELSGREVHEGPVLTIPGTLMQNEALLNYYRTVWQCVGLEMEGTYYARQVEESRNLDLLPQNVTTRYAYYTSDVPLASSTGASLAQSMKLSEGLPPLYAITRHFLELLLADWE